MQSGSKPSSGLIADKWIEKGVSLVVEAGGEVGYDVLLAALHTRER